MESQYDRERAEMDYEREQAWKAEQAKKSVFDFKPLPEISMAGWNAKEQVEAAAYVEPEPEPGWDDDHAGYRRQQPLQIPSQPDPEWEPNPLLNPQIHNLLQLVTQACVRELVFKALSKVFSEIVEKFEKPNVPISATAFWDTQGDLPLDVDFLTALQKIESRRSQDANHQRILQAYVESVKERPSARMRLRRESGFAEGGLISKPKPFAWDFEAIKRADPPCNCRCQNDAIKQIEVRPEHVWMNGVKVAVPAKPDPSVAAIGGTLNVGASRRFIHHAFEGGAKPSNSRICNKCGEHRSLHPEFQPRAPCSGSQRQEAEHCNVVGSHLIAPERSQDEPASECEECWGTGAYHGWGKNCSRGCAKP